MRDIIKMFIVILWLLWWYFYFKPVKSIVNNKQWQNLTIFKVSNYLTLWKVKKLNFLLYNYDLIEDKNNKKYLKQSLNKRLCKELEGKAKERCVTVYNLE